MQRFMQQSESIYGTTEYLAKSIDVAGSLWVGWMRSATYFLCRKMAVESLVYTQRTLLSIDKNHLLCFHFGFTHCSLTWGESMTLFSDFQTRSDIMNLNQNDSFFTGTMGDITVEIVYLICCWYFMNFISF